LTVVLSCWDCIEGQVGDKSPFTVLTEKLPAFTSFITSVWNEHSFQVIGLSSTEKTLSNNNPDMDFVKKGPESFGYIITKEGRKEKDLTLSISQFVGKES
jgi:hypothetical protein